MNESSSLSPRRLSVVVPAYNEARNLEPVVLGAIRELESSPWVGSYEVIIVDDGSTDDTGGVAARLAGQFPGNVRMHRHPANRGFGAALRTGHAAALGEYVTVIPADGEVGIDQALGLFRRMGEADLVISRRERAVAAHRVLLTIGFRWLTRLILGVDPRGVEGIYVVRRAMLRQVSIRSDTGLASLELFIRCRQRRCRIEAGVIRASPRLSGTSKVTNLRSIALTLREMIRLRLALGREGSE